MLMRVFSRHRSAGWPAALALEVVQIGALDDALVIPERAGLLQKAVDQGGFAVVDMRDDRDVARDRGSRKSLPLGEAGTRTRCGAI